MSRDYNYTLNIPASDAALFKSLIKRMGWKAKMQKPQKISRLEAAVKAAHEDELFETDDIDVLMKSLKE
ncbi:MAG: hypothetical protein Q4D41_02815 [Prevotellaceae bacterium]|nr:hypothetical protein [Prevotellaceae bacterium]